MKLANTLVAATAVSMACAATPTKKYVKLPFGKADAELAKRAVNDDYIGLDLENDDNIFAVQIGVGTPAQNVTVLLSNRYSPDEFWVVGSDNLYCKTNQGKKPKGDKSRVLEMNSLGYPTDEAGLVYKDRNLNCKKFGVFNSSNSSSFDMDSDNDRFFVSGSGAVFASGYFGIDSVTVGGFKLDDISFGVANLTNTTYGVMGIGLPTVSSDDGKASNASNISSIYGVSNYTNPRSGQNFLAAMKDQGYIKKEAYSMYFANSNDDEGVILFGAIDNLAFQNGTLFTVPILRDFVSGASGSVASNYSLSGLYSNSTVYSNSTSSNSTAGRFSNSTRYTNSSSSNSSSSTASSAGGFTIALDSISFTNKSGPSVNVLDEPIPVTLDTGVTGFILTQDLYDSLQTLMDPSSNDTGFKLDKCPKDTDNVTFTFSGANVTLKMKDLIIKRKGKCYLDVTPGDNVVFGNSFLKNVFAVYDLEDEEVSLAPVLFSKNENIVEIDGSIPGAIMAPGYNSEGSSSSSNGTNSTRNTTYSNASTYNRSRLVRRQVHVNSGVSAKSAGLLAALVSFAAFTLLF